MKLEWIANDAARRATFKKRRKGLMKKVSELSTLCDVRSCLIVYGHNEATPEVWPSVPEAVRVLAKLKRMPEMEQSKKMMNQEGFMRQRITKLQEQLRKQDRESRELETTLLMHQCLMGVKGLDGVGIEEVTSLAWLIEMKANEAKKRIEGWCNDKPSGSAAMPATRAPGKGVVKVEEVPVGPAAAMTGAKAKGKSPMEVAMEELQRQEWFTDIMNPPPPPASVDHQQHQNQPHHENTNGSDQYGHYMEQGAGNSSSSNHGGNNPWLDAYFPLN